MDFSTLKQSPRTGADCWALLLSILLFLSFFSSSSVAASDKPFKVLVVFSYEEDFLWDIEIKQALEKCLSPHAELTYVYLNTKEDLAGGTEKAAQAYELFRQLKPDGVLAADDNAQSLFVVPYLKNKTPTPVVFCGVNVEPEVYGYPAENVTGILERYHFEATISLSRMLAGEIKSVVIMGKENPSSRILRQQFFRDQGRWSAVLLDVLLPEALPEAVRLAREYRSKADLLILLPFKGIVDAQGRPVNETRAITAVVEAFGKPTGAFVDFIIRHGALSGVLATGEEQGEVSAGMLLELMRGRPVSETPISRNHRGKRIINVTTLKQLGLIPDPMALRGAELITTETY